MQQRQKSALMTRAASNAVDLETQAMTMATQAMARGSSVSEMLAVARSVQREGTVIMNIANQAKADALIAYESGAGALLVNNIRNLLPQFANLQLVGIPSNSGEHVHVVAATPKDIEHALFWAAGNSKSQSLGPAMEKYWNESHTTVMHDDKLAVDDPDEETECYDAGVCLCSPEGKKLKRMANKFLAYAKLICPFGSTKRGELRDGKFVVRLIGRPASYEDCIGGEIVDVWCHIGFQSLSPFRPTFMGVRPVADVGELACDRTWA